MTRNSGTPAERPVLALAAEPCSAPELEEAEHTEQGAELVPVPLAERAGTAVANAARELWLHPDRLIHGLIHAAPDPTRDHWEYAKSGEWVPQELHGTRAGKAVMAAGLLYHLFAVAADKALQGLESGVRKARWTVQRPLRLLCLAVPVLILILLFAL